jgi:hypothetical protein
VNPCDNQNVERIHCGDPGLGVGGFEPYSLVAITKIVPGSPSLGQLPIQHGLLRLARFRALADRTHPVHEVLTGRHRLAELDYISNGRSSAEADRSSGQ